MNQKGTVKSVSEVVVVSDKFKKRELVITTNDQYPQTLLFQVGNDKCDLLNNLKQGDIVDVQFNLRGREWENTQGEKKVFNTLEAWKIDKDPVSSTPANVPASVGDDLPF